MLTYKRRSIKTVTGFMIVIALAFSWLAFPYLMNGKNLLFNTGDQVKMERKKVHSTLSQYLGRMIMFPGGIQLNTIYASQEYFEYADHANTVSIYRPDTHFVFFINEDVHTGDLPFGLPDAVLEIDGKRITPVSIDGPDSVEHHRTTIVRFSKFDENGNPLLTGNAKQLKLILTHPWDRNRYTEDGLSHLPIRANMSWNLPLEIPESLRSKDSFTTAMILSLSAGLLSAVLTPCLLQLAVVFLATLGGVGAEGVVASKGQVTPELRKKVTKNALGFILGYVGLFVCAGALIGYIGKEAQLFFASYTRMFGMGSGIIIILFGLWIGIRSNTPVICKLPGAALINRQKSTSSFSTIIVAIAFSLGCMSCFGGAIIGTLFIYVGALGSATTGAVVMGIFSLGVAIPFMLASLYFTKMSSVFEAVAKHSKSISLVSMIIIVAFGLLLVTDKFHVLSDAIYPYLGLN